MSRDATSTPDALLADPARVAALRATDLMDTMPEEAFDRLTRLARATTGAPVSLVSLIDADRHFVKSSVGLEGPWEESREIPLERSFCALVVERNAPLVIADTDEHETAAEYPGLRGDIRAYAGMPLITRDGHVIGTLCAADGEARPWTDDQLAALRDLTALVSSEIDLRAAVRVAEARTAELEAATTSIRTLHGALDAADVDTVAAGDRAMRIAADLAHELRTPLYAIRNLTEDLAGDAPEPLQGDLRMIDATTQEALQVIDHQLEMARQAGRAVVRTSTVTVPELFRALRGMLTPLMRRPEVGLVFDDVSALPAMETDGLKVAQILRNLGTNALRHTYTGEVRVCAVEVGGAIAFTVADTGIGIAPEDHDRVFARFEQVAGPEQRGGSGLGLGLARRMARMLGGDVVVESELGRGSRFTATIPLRVPTDDPAISVVPVPRSA